MSALKIVLRITLLGVLVLLGFTAVFPEWLDFKDSLIRDRKMEAAKVEELGINTF